MKLGVQRMTNQLFLADGLEQSVLPLNNLTAQQMCIARVQKSQQMRFIFAFIAITLFCIVYNHSAKDSSIIWLLFVKMAGYEYRLKCIFPQIVISHV